MNSDYYFQQGVKYTDSGNYKEAISCFEKVVQIDPQNYTAWLDMGVVYFNLGEFEKSEKCYKFILEHKPNSNCGGAYNNLANIESLKKNYDVAMSLYKKAIECDSENIDAFYGLGGVCLLQHKYDLARSCYEKILSLDKNHLYANIALGNIYMIFNQIDIANNFFIRAAQLGSSEAKNLLNKQGIKWY